MCKLFKYIIIYPVYLCIIVYQLFISPFLTPSCRFHPSCSCYAKQAIKKHELKGIVMSIKRILKCNPLFDGGIDILNQENYGK